LISPSHHAFETIPAPTVMVQEQDDTSITFNGTKQDEVDGFDVSVHPSPAARALPKYIPEEEGKNNLSNTLATKYELESIKAIEEAFDRIGNDPELCSLAVEKFREVTAELLKECQLWEEYQDQQRKKRALSGFTTAEKEEESITSGYSVNDKRRKLS
jgi:hypothetical protein